jgi:hypothetical protein
MPFRIDRAVVDRQFGGADALTAAVAVYRQARQDHAATEGVPAPTAHPIVEDLVAFWGGEFDVVEPEPEAAPAVPARRMVAKSLIVQRLHETGYLAAAKLALDADLYARELWYAPDRPSLYFDDADAVALLEGIEADVAAIMAPPAGV